MPRSGRPTARQVNQSSRSPVEGPTTAGRACHPDVTGFACGPDGVRIAFEVFGAGDPPIILLPSAPIIHSRQWKAQVPYLSRRHRVITYDGRGNGLSDRPIDPLAYHDDRMTRDIETVMDATGTPAAVLVGLCVDGVWRAIRIAAEQPERVLGIVAFAVGVPRLSPPQPHYLAAGATFDDELPAYEGWAKMNRHHWRADYRDWVQFFFSEITSEPHSTKAIEDAVEWALDGSVDAMLAESEAVFPFDVAAVEAICRSVHCPMLLVHGTEDTCQSIARAERLADLTGAPLVVVDGADHMIPGRHPVMANLLIRDFIRSLSEAMP
jgi:pimeloyl-ACP methyl ester carboxylesterase